MRPPLSIMSSYFGAPPGDKPGAGPYGYKPDRTRPPVVDPKPTGPSAAVDTATTPYTQPEAYAPAQIAATVLPSNPNMVASVQAPANPTMAATVAPPTMEATVAPQPSGPTRSPGPMQPRRSPENRRTNGFARSVR